MTDIINNFYLEPTTGNEPPDGFDPRRALILVVFVIIGYFMYDFGKRKNLFETVRPRTVRISATSITPTPTPLSITTTEPAPEPISEPIPIPEPVPEPPKQ